MHRYAVLSLLILTFACSRPPQVTEHPIHSDPSDQSVYIPNDLDDSHAELLRMLPPKTIEEMKKGAEADMVQYHFGLGMWMRNNWGLWKGSRLSQYFNAMNVKHPDDMSGIILATFWCKLNGQPFRLAERVAEIQEGWRQGRDPEDRSPRDGAEILWVITKMKERPFVHLGVSTSDKSFWRVAVGHPIEPATNQDANELEALMQRWKELGSTPEELK